jgi:hypothetical protein
MTDLLVAIGLVLVIEGLLLAAVPNRIRDALEAMRITPETTLRAIGLGAAVLGVIVVWLVRG